MKNRWLFLFVGLFICCVTSVNHFDEVLIGSWRIENPSGQSFVRFKKNGDVFFYFDRYRFEKDSLVEKGEWQLEQPIPKTIKDTLKIKLTTQKGIHALNFVIESQNRLKNIGHKTNVFYGRME